MTYSHTHVNKLIHFWIKSSKILKCLVSRVPKAFWRNPRADLSLQPSKRRWGLACWFLLPWYYKWILVLHLCISINNVKLTQPQITSEPLFPAATSFISYHIITKPAWWTCLTCPLKEQSHIVNETTNRIYMLLQLLLILSVKSARCDLAPNLGIN